MNDKRTKIVCTIGPASDDPEILEQLMRSGLNVCRVNFSHGTHEEHKKRFDMIKEVRDRVKPSVAILLDTKGPEIRTGKFRDPEVLLQAGGTYTLTTEEYLGDERKCSVSYDKLTHDVSVGSRILIDDGNIEMTVTSIEGNDIHCTVENTGIIKNNKGINIPGVIINLPSLTEKDVDDIVFGIHNNIDIIAASFVRKASDVLAIRELLELHKAEDIQIISKIENQQGVDNIDEILTVSDGIMVARGDLGVEIPVENIPIVQKTIIKKCNALSKPVVTATQMLDSMMRNPRPTRAEVTDVSNAVYDGSDAIMLSGETAAGKYPVESVEMMRSIALTTENSVEFNNRLEQKKKQKEANITNAISHATCMVARELSAKAIVTATTSGYTARMVSSFRPGCNIIAGTHKEIVRRQLSLVWGVVPIMLREATATDELIEEAVSGSLEAGWISSGDVVVITAGVPVSQTGATNLIKVQLVADILVRGTGIGTKSVSGPVKIITDGTETIGPEDILVAKTTDIEFAEQMRTAKAYVVEEGGLTSHAAIFAVSLGKTVVVGAEGIVDKVKDGEMISIEPAKGFVYRGNVNIF